MGRGGGGGGGWRTLRSLGMENGQDGVVFDCFEGLVCLLFIVVILFIYLFIRVILNYIYIYIYIG